MRAVHNISSLADRQPADTDDFLAYLRANTATRDLAEAMRWVLARRSAVADLEGRRAS